MKEYINRWRNEFDHIIIDTPPCLSVTDAAVLSPEADRVIVVARAGKTTKLALRRACDLLLRVNARVMGIVLNAIDIRAGHGYYYPYGGPDAKHYFDEHASQDETTTASKVS
jgi:Mrp family chromosome partitioning ATPase